MAPNPKETLLDWLRDAHAMEGSIATLLEKQAQQFKNRPELQAKINEHLQVTREQRDRVKTLIEGMGGEVSTVKEVTGKMLTNMQAMMNMVAPDGNVKNMIGNLAVEHFEIASYKSLIAAATALGETEVQRVCQQILEQEQEMASWVDHHIAGVTTEYLGKAQQQTMRS